MTPPDPADEADAEFKFTGEQAVPGGTPERIMRDHEARYAFAVPHVRSQRVLDIACGTGYGTKRLAQAGAAHVVGIDVHAGAIEHAKRAHSHPRLEFQVGDILRLPFSDGSVDVVACFETIEHVDDDRGALEELHRILRPQGRLLLSTPNRIVTSPLKTLRDPPNNRHHVREYDRGELEALLATRFRIVQRLGQRVRAAPLFWPAVYRRLKKRRPKLYDPARGDPTPRRVGPLGTPRYFVYVLERR